MIDLWDFSHWLKLICFLVQVFTKIRLSTSKSPQIYESRTHAESYCVLKLMYTYKQRQLKIKQNKINYESYEKFLDRKWGSYTNKKHDSYMYLVMPDSWHDLVHLQSTPCRKRRRVGDGRVSEPFYSPFFWHEKKLQKEKRLAECKIQTITWPIGVFPGAQLWDQRGTAPFMTTFLY